MAKSRRKNSFTHREYSNGGLLPAGEWSASLPEANQILRFMDSLPVFIRALDDTGREIYGNREWRSLVASFPGDAPPSLFEDENSAPKEKNIRLFWRKLPENEAPLTTMKWTWYVGHPVVKTEERDTNSLPPRCGMNCAMLNGFQTISSLLTFERDRQRRNSPARHALEVVLKRIGQMNLVYDFLRNNVSSGEYDVKEYFDYVLRHREFLSVNSSPSRICISAETAHIPFGMFVPLATLCTLLLSNALARCSYSEKKPGDASIVAHACQKDNFFLFSVSDECHSILTADDSLFTDDLKFAAFLAGTLHGTLHFEKKERFSVTLSLPLNGSSA